jgi:hypothetical protein
MVNHRHMPNLQHKPCRKAGLVPRWTLAAALFHTDSEWTARISACCGATTRASRRHWPTSHHLDALIGPPYLRMHHARQASVSSRSEGALRARTVGVEMEGREGALRARTVGVEMEGREGRGGEGQERRGRCTPREEGVIATYV